MIPFSTIYLNQLQQIAERVALPKIKALHLPPQIQSDDQRGEFCALELEDGAIGLSYVLLDDTLERLTLDNSTTRLDGSNPLTLASQYVTGEGSLKTLGFAAANAITNHFFRRCGFTPPSSGDSIGGITPQQGERIGMVGLFRPLLERILAAGATLTVVELDPELVKVEKDVRITLDPGALADCHKIIATSTLLLNDTLDPILQQARQAEQFVMIGPSAGCLPDALFQRGVTMLGGSWIEDRVGFLQALTTGEKHSTYVTKFALTRENYRGFTRLLEELPVVD